MNKPNELALNRVLKELKQTIRKYEDKADLLGIVRRGYQGEPPVRTNEDLFFKDYFSKIEECYKKLRNMKKTIS